MSHDRDVLHCPIESSRNVVDFREVGRTDRVETASGSRELWYHAAVSRARKGARAMVHRLSWKIMEREHTIHDGRQRHWDLRVAYVGLAGFAVHIEMMDFRMKRISDLPCVSRKLDGRARSAHLDSLESLASKPVGYCLNIGIGRPKLCAELLRRQPLMKIGRILALLLPHQFLQRRILLRAALQQQQHAAHGRCVAHPSLIKFLPAARGHAALS